MLRLQRVDAWARRSAVKTRRTHDGWTVENGLGTKAPLSIGMAFRLENRMDGGTDDGPGSDQTPGEQQENLSFVPPDAGDYWYHSALHSRKSRFGHAA